MYFVLQTLILKWVQNTLILKWVHVIDYLASKPCSTTFAALQAAAGRAARFVTGWSATFAPAGRRCCLTNQSHIISVRVI